MSGLSVNSVVKSYRTGRNTTLLVLNGVSFELAEGECVAICGPNGCGKTSLLNILAGLDHGYTGSVFINGSAPDPKHVGYVFQDPTESLFPWLSVLANVTFALRMRHVGKQERLRRGRAALDEIGLTDFAQHYPYQLSGGMKQKACIARALADDRKLLLLDEPFASLDTETVSQLEQDFMRLWEHHHLTTLFVSHDLDEAVMLSDRILLLSHRPSRVLASIDVPLPRPRTPSMMTDPLWLATKTRIIEISQSEGSILR